MEGELSCFNEIEDGEITDEPNLYTPLERVPISIPKLQQNNKTEEDEEEDNPNIQSFSDSDSSDSCSDKKKKRKKVVPIKPSFQTAKKKKYNIWCNDLQTEVLTDTLMGCNVDQSNIRSRDVETYNYKLGFNKDRYSTNLINKNSYKNINKHRDEEDYNEQDAKVEISDFDYLLDCDDDKSNKRSHDGTHNYKMGFVRNNSSNYKNKRKHKDVHLEKGEEHFNEQETMTGTCRNILELEIDIGDSDEKIAKNIANKLYEKKESLILQAIQVLGKQKVIEIFDKVRKIEAEGGLLIMNGARRRTPGGVFFFLLKSLDSISRDQVKLIFMEDKKLTLQKKKDDAKKIQREKAAKFKAEMAKEAAKNIETSRRSVSEDLEGNDDMEENEDLEKLNNKSTESFVEVP